MAVHSLPSPLQMSYTALDSSLPQVTCYLYSTQQKRKRQTSVVELMREEHSWQEIRSGASLHSVISGLQAVFLAMPALWKNKGCMPSVSFGKSGPLLVEEGVLLWFLPSSVPWVSFPRDGVGWEGTGQREGLTLVCLPLQQNQGMSKVRAWGNSNHPCVVLSRGSLWGLCLMMTVGKPGYPGLLPSLVLHILHLSCFYQ